MSFKKQKKMRKTVNLVAVVGSIFLTSCGSSTPAVVVKPVADVVVALPCSGYEYETQAGVFRSSQSALSTDLSTSREKALLATKRTLASMIGGTIKSVTDRYAQDRTIGAKSNFSEKFENLTREVVEQRLQGVRKICEITKQKPDGRYETFVAIELNTNDVFQGLENNIAKDDELRQDYDKQKFEGIFNEEMKKLKEDQN